MRAARSCWLLLALLACSPAADPPRAHPDLLLVVIDTLRADRVSAYGYPRATTPQLDALAELGVLFEDVTAPAPWTWPSHASLFTGESPAVHGARLAVADRDPLARETEVRFGLPVTRLRDELPTLAERFRERGYRSVALVANEWLDPQLGLLRGFERAELFADDARVVEAVAAAMAEDDPRPLFLFVNLMTAHSPYREGPGPWALGDAAFLDPAQAPGWVRPYLTEDLPRGVELTKRADGAKRNGELRYAAGDLALTDRDLDRIARLYAASVRGADFALGRILERWIDASPESVIAVTSDHGEALGEHGRLGHQASVHPEVLRVPLVIAAPDRLPAGRRIAAPVQLQDLHPTLLELAGLPGSDRSLLPLAAGRGDAPDGPVQAAVERHPAYATLPGGRLDRDQRLHRAGRWALLWSAADPGARELYDLRRDPGMRSDLSDREPQRLAQLWAAAREHHAREGGSPGEPLVVPDAVARRLEALGYVGPAEN